MGLLGLPSSLQSLALQSSRGPDRRVTALIAGVVVLTSGTLPSEAAKVPQPREIAYRTWTSTADFLAGAQSGTTVADGALTFGTSTGTTSYVDPFGDGTAKSYDQTSWTSPDVTPGFGLTELIASWNATTPPGTWVEVAMSGRTDSAPPPSGTCSAAGPAATTPRPATSTAPRCRPRATRTDPLPSTPSSRAGDRSLDRWQLKVTLYRLSGTTQAPVVRSVGAMASRLPDAKKVAVEPPRRCGGHRTRRADVLAGDPHRALPAVGRRRRGLVLGDVDGDGARLLRRRADRRGDRLGRSGRRRSAGGPRGPLGLRLRLRRRRATGRSTRRTPGPAASTGSSPGCGR